MPKQIYNGKLSLYLLFTLISTRCYDALRANHILLSSVFLPLPLRFSSSQFFSCSFLLGSPLYTFENQTFERKTIKRQSASYFLLYLSTTILHAFSKTNKFFSNKKNILDESQLEHLFIRIRMLCMYN